MELKTSGAPASETSGEFHQGMVNRMATSYYKYGPLAKNYPDPGNAIASLRKRLDLYESDGNTEWLMDVANFAMIEFMRPMHAKAHFRATEAHESPGITTWKGHRARDKAGLQREAQSPEDIADAMTRSNDG